MIVKSDQFDDCDLSSIAAAGADVGGALFLKRRKENEEDAE